MKIFKYLIILSVLGIVTPSCVDDTAPEDAFGGSPNLASFVNSSNNLSVVADGEQYNFELPMVVKGPSLDALSGTVTATVSVDPSSTAIEGTHFTLDQTTVTFTRDGDFVNELPITILTDGIEPPLEEAPVIVLRVSNVSGVSNVIANGKTLSLNLLYLCASDLAGDYEIHMTRTAGSGAVTQYTFDETISQTGDGEYRGLVVGHYGPNGLGVGDAGFDFVDVCGDITVPLQNLVNYYSNEVYGIGDSYVYDNGDLHIEYEITFAAGNSQYVVDYIKQ